MIIAITGGRGFIGRATTAYALAHGHAVVSFDRPEHDLLGSLDALGDADAVIHLAGVLGTAELFETPELAVNVNVIGTLRVLEWCEKHGARYVGITMPPVFPSVYTATKLCADRLTAAWVVNKGLRASRVRAFNAYGPWQRFGPGHPQKIVPTFAREAWAGRPIPIWGNGTQTVDLVHADDLGRMLVEATRFGMNEVFDGGTGTALSVNEVADRVIRITGSKAGVEYLPMRKGEVPTEIVATGEGWDRILGPKFEEKKFEEAVLWYKDPPPWPM